MSYLHTPRISIHGTFEAGGVTANNVLAARDEVNTPAFKPADWHNNNYSSNQFLVSGEFTQVVSAWDENGPVASDPVLGAAVSGDGMMADLDPEHRRVTDLFGLELTFRRSPPPAPAVRETRVFFRKQRLKSAAPALETFLKGTLKTTQLRDFWVHEIPPDFVVYPVSTAWQSVLHSLTWFREANRSKILRRLREVSGEKLSVRFIMTRFDDTNQLKRVGKLLAVIGPHYADEPEQIAPGRRLISADGKDPYVGFPAASFIVDERRRKLVVDLGNLFPRTLDPAAGLVHGLTANVAGNTIGNPREITVGSWLTTAGLVEWNLSDQEQDLLAANPLQLEFTDPSRANSSILNEHIDGKYVDVDRRSLRLNPGEEVKVPVYARQFGKPLAGEVIQFRLHRQRAEDPIHSLGLQPCDPYYPRDPNAKINSRPADVFVSPPPFTVTTNAKGFAELRLKVKDGPFRFPLERQSINSQLYFLGDPDGWQRWGALGPEVGAHCALSVLLFNKGDTTVCPNWKTVGPILARYARLYPIMNQIIDLTDEATVRANALRIRQRLMAPVDSIQHMPVTRDLSLYERDLIVRFLDSVIATHQGC